MDGAHNNRHKAEGLVTAYAGQIYAFCRKRTASLQDAEDLAQEICLKLFSALCAKGLPEYPDRFVFTVAHNQLANYYRRRARTAVGTPEALDTLADPAVSAEQRLCDKETVARLHSQIAYLSHLRREIVILHYYDGKKLTEIAGQLGLPIGTVKWHLSQAKSELKKGLNSMDDTSILKCRPIEFDENIGFSGSVGSRDYHDFLKSLINQNILYCVYQTGKTVHEIADCLGVSPLFVQSQTQILEEYGLLTVQNGRYYANLLIEQPTAAFFKLTGETYSKAAELIAAPLFDALMQTDLPKQADPFGHDPNFTAWSLIPYMLSRSGNEITDLGVSFEQAATIRSDGGQNIITASVRDTRLKTPACMNQEQMQHWTGPIWNSDGVWRLWQLETGFSQRPKTDLTAYPRAAGLLFRLLRGDDPLSKEELAFLAQRNLVKKEGAGFVPAMIRINKDQNDRLLQIADTVKRQHAGELQTLHQTWLNAYLQPVPRRLHSMAKYGAQHLFDSNGWFLLFCLRQLTDTGLLQPVSPDRQSMLHMLLIAQ